MEIQRKTANTVSRHGVENGDLWITLPIYVVPQRSEFLNRIKTYFEELKVRETARLYVTRVYADPELRAQFGNPGLITLIRLSPGMVESDNLWSCLKNVRDGISDVFAGQSKSGKWLGSFWDADQRKGACQWQVNQQVTQDQYGVIARFTPRPAGSNAISDPRESVSHTVRRRKAKKS